MHSFTDTKNRTWDLEITTFAVKRVLSRTGVNIQGLIVDGDPTPLGELLGDACKLSEVLYCLCLDQCEKQGVPHEDFDRGLAGDALAAAEDAFVKEFIFFIRNPKVRAALTAFMKKVERVRDRSIANMEKAVEEFDPESVDLEKLAKRSIKPSGNSPDNSASTPAPSPSGNST